MRTVVIIVFILISSCCKQDVMSLPAYSDAFCMSPSATPWQLIINSPTSIQQLFIHTVTVNDCNRQRYLFKVLSSVEPVNYLFTLKTNLMARQKSPQKMKGTVGGLTYYKGKGGHLVREAGGIDKARIEKDPVFKRTRENMAEFTEASRVGKLIRQTFRSLLVSTADGRVTSRLFSVLSSVIKSDTVNARGKRSVAAGNLLLLEGFEFNVNAVFANTLYAPYATTIERSSGQFTAELPAFVPEKMISAPYSASHFKIISAAAAIDLVNNKFEVKEQTTPEIALDIATTEAINLQNTVAANSQHALVFLMGIEFYQETNGRMYLLQDHSFNALSIIKVEEPATP